MLGCFPWTTGRRIHSEELKPVHPVPKDGFYVQPNEAIVIALSCRLRGQRSLLWESGMNQSNTYIKLVPPNALAPLPELCTHLDSDVVVIQEEHKSGRPWAV
jgi:hypothetical protein